MSGWTPAKYKTTNRSSCNDAVKQRGSLSIRFDPGMVRTPPPSAEFHRCRDPNLPDHEGAVWYATPPDDRVGAEPVATGRSALGRTRFQHLVSQAEDAERDPSVSRRHRPAQPADCPTRCLPGLTGLTGVPPPEPGDRGLKPSGTQNSRAPVPDRHSSCRQLWRDRCP